MMHEIIHGSGIQAETGQYSDTLPLDKLYAIIEAEYQTLNADNQSWLMKLLRRKPRVLGLPSFVAKDPNNLAKANWGIILPSEEGLNAQEREHITALRECLQPLLELREQQMQSKKAFEFRSKADWKCEQFLWEEGRKVRLENVKPEIVPYYLCIVGSPQHISWEFQQGLDIYYAVGRLWFDDVEDCKSYIQHLISYEQATQHLFQQREILFFGTQNSGDTATAHSSQYLIKPLHDWLTMRDDLNFNSSLLVSNEATKANLLRRLRGDEFNGTQQAPPSLLFSATHGAEYEKQKPAEQYAKQGALILQDWPGGLASVKPEHCLAGNDITDLFKVAGMMAFCFACYSAGTPVKEDWVYPTKFMQARSLANTAFVAKLPQKMLCQGLLAFIGHVSKTWIYSFRGPEEESDQTDPFKETLYRLLQGERVGYAIEYYNQQWPTITKSLHSLLEEKQPDKEAVVSTWMARNDCRGFVVLGDPAARLRPDLLI